MKRTAEGSHVVISSRLGHGVRELQSLHDNRKLSFLSDTIMYTEPWRQDFMSMLENKHWKLFVGSHILCETGACRSTNFFQPQMYVLNTIGESEWKVAIRVWFVRPSDQFHQNW